MALHAEVSGDLEVETVSDEVFINNWATKNKISGEVIEKLKQDGFTSMDALVLIDREDLAKSKLAIPRGQQKLVLAAVQKFIQTEGLAQAAAAHAPQTAGNDIGQSAGTDGTTQTPSNKGMAGTQQRSMQSPAAHAPTEKEKSTSGCHISDDPYLKALLQQIRTGQGQDSGANIVVIPCNSESVNTQFLNGLGIQQNGANVNEPPAPSAGVTVSDQPWRDPQIYLQAAASGKSSLSYHDVTDFVAGNVEEEIIVGGNGSQQVILKSGPKKPKLESVTLAQWSVANLAILYRLLGEGKLEASNILDYLSYTTKICQLVQKFNLVSVLMYDREYRKLQATHHFRWGTDIPHLHSVHLQARPVKYGQPGGKGYNSSGNSQVRSHQGPMTTEGKIICKLYNSKGGCHYKECKFQHQCSQPGCHQKHSAISHVQPKNM